jgi:rSAM/selenodomain-associated transferase 1
MTTSALVIFAKSPRPGRVKTRLCPPLSAVDAARVQEAFLRDTVGRARALTDVQVVCAYTPSDDRVLFEQVCGDTPLVAQAGSDLGERLDAAFATLALRGARQMVAIGSDTPTVPLAYLRQAFALLDDPTADVVLGPAEDGGYYLIGLRTPRSELFTDMPWSTDRVFGETCRRAEALRLQVRCLPPWYDVDAIADLERLAKELRDAPADAHETRAVLAALGLL